MFEDIERRTRKRTRRVSFQMNTYKFAAAIYRVSGRVDYVDQAIRTYRGIVSHDAGEHIMHMAIRNEDIATIQAILDVFPMAGLAFDNAGVRAILPVIKQVNSRDDAVVARDILYRIVRSIVYANMPRHCHAVELCVRYSTGLVNGTTVACTAASAIITQIMKEYAAEYVPPKHPTVDERDFGIALRAYAYPDTASSIDLHKIRMMITPDVRGEYTVSPLTLTFEPDNQHWLARETEKLAAFVLDDSDDTDDTKPCGEVYGPSEEMRAWNYVHDQRWSELADILDSSCEIPRRRGKAWIIRTICRYCKPLYSERILRAVLRRWPQLYRGELYEWMIRRNADEIKLLMDIAPYQPNITRVFVKIEYEICTDICREHWGFNVARYERLDALQRLYLMQNNYVAPSMHLA